jgi:predicted transcriptional regulator
MQKSSTFEKEIRKLWIDKDITAAIVAKKLNMSPNSLYSILRKSAMRPEKFDTLMKALSVSVTEKEELSKLCRFTGNGRVKGNKTTGVKRKLVITSDDLVALKNKKVVFTKAGLRTILEHFGIKFDMDV